MPVHSTGSRISPVAASILARYAPMWMHSSVSFRYEDLLLAGPGVQRVDGLDQGVMGGVGQMVVDQAVVDLRGQLHVHQVTDPGPVRIGEDRHHLMDRLEGGIAGADEFADEDQTLASPGDGEGQEHAEQERGHAGERHLDAQLAVE